MKLSSFIRLTRPIKLIKPIKPIKPIKLINPINPSRLTKTFQMGLVGLLEADWQQSRAVQGSLGLIGNCAGTGKKKEAAFSASFVRIVVLSQIGSVG